VGSPERLRLRDELVRGHLPVAQHIARRFSRRGEPEEDLEQVATLGLINAVDRYDPDRGTDFLSYAVPTITGEVRRHFRDQAWSMRVPRREKRRAMCWATGRCPRTSSSRRRSRSGEPISSFACSASFGMRWSYSPREELRRPFDRPPEPVSFVAVSAAGRGAVSVVSSDSAVSTSTASAVSLVVVVAVMASMEVTSVVSGVGGGAGSEAGVTAPGSRDARA